jgi:hypothetical protein
LLVSCCVGGKCDMVRNDEDQGKSRTLGAEGRGGSCTSWVLDGWTIGRSGDAACDPHRTRGGDEKHGFFDLASKLVAMVCRWLGLKTTWTISWFGPQNQGRLFSDLGLKIIATVS